MSSNCLQHPIIMTSTSALAFQFTTLYILFRKSSYRSVVWWIPPVNTWDASGSRLQGNDGGNWHGSALNNLCESVLFFKSQMHFKLNVKSETFRTENLCFHTNNGSMILISLSQVAQLPLAVSDGRWHHICITWTTRDGFWEAYQDGERLGTGENLAPWHPIKPGGVIILGQEQVIARKRESVKLSRGRR